VTYVNELNQIHQIKSKLISISNTYIILLTRLAPLTETMSHSIDHTATIRSKMSLRKQRIPHSIKCSIDNRCCCLWSRQFFWPLCNSNSYVSNRQFDGNCCRFAFL